MHPVSTAFYKIPENKLVADTFAIVMGSSHCEPLLLNTASEWNSKTMGPWDYGKNKDKINEVLGNRVKENCAYENVYTLALRGLHDAAMGGGGHLYWSISAGALIGQIQFHRHLLHTRRCWKSIRMDWNCLMM